MSEAAAARERAALTKRERSRAAILAAATVLFERDGFASTSVEAIAAAAGVGVATVYNNFANKQLIAAFTFRPVVAHILDDPSWVSEPDEARACLMRILRELITRGRERVGLTRALLEAVNEGTARAGGQLTEADPRYWLPFPRLLAGIVERGQAQGSFPDYPSAMDVGTLLNNNLLLRIFTRPEESTEDTCTLILTMADRLLTIA